jgi:hypothetical protein
MKFNNFFKFTAFLLCLSSIFGTFTVYASDANSQYLKLIDDREQGDDSKWDVSLQLIDKNGYIRKRTGQILRISEGKGADKLIRQITIFLSPRNIRHVGLLSIDREGESEDSMWLYLAAFKKIKRIPASKRGDNFVGTDFSYEDVKLGFEYQDYVVNSKNERSLQEYGTVDYLEIEPKTIDLKKALGFYSSHLYVLQNIYMIVRQDFFSKNGKLIKRFTASNVEQINGIWTARTLIAHNFETEHQTILTLDDAHYNIGLPQSLFTKRTLLMEKIR